MRQWRFIVWFALFNVGCAGVAQDRPGQVEVDPAQAVAEARAMVDEILSRQVDASVTNQGSLRIRSGNQTMDRSIQFSAFAADGKSVFLYEVKSPAAEKMTLKIVSTPRKPNAYLISKGGGEMQELSADQLILGLGGSDFWVMDLGLEFLHWPNQRLLKKEMRRSQWCHVLESENPKPNPGGYRRVVSWIDVDTGGIVHADAYDVRNRLLKQFDPKIFRKVQGSWELEQMEIRNRQTGSRSVIEFHLAQ